MTEKEELEYYRKLSSDLNADPDVALEFGRILKKVRPEVNNPQVNFLEKSETKLKSEFELRDKKIDELSKQLLERQVADKLERDRQILRGGKFNFGESEISAVEKWMAEKGVLDYEAAGEVYLANHQPAPANRFTGLNRREVLTEPSKIEKMNEGIRTVFKKRRRDNEAFDKAYAEVTSPDFFKR
jgi:hypothetical protein